MCSGCLLWIHPHIRSGHHDTAHLLFHTYSGLSSYASSGFPARLEEMLWGTSIESSRSHLVALEHCSIFLGTPFCSEEFHPGSHLLWTPHDPLPLGGAVVPIEWAYLQEEHCCRCHRCLIPREAVHSRSFPILHSWESPPPTTF